MAKRLKKLALTLCTGKLASTAFTASAVTVTTTGTVNQALPAGYSLEVYYDSWHACQVSPGQSGYRYSCTYDVQITGGKAGCPTTAASDFRLNGSGGTAAYQVATLPKSTGTTQPCTNEINLTITQGYSTEQKAELILDCAEKVAPQYFTPHAATSITQSKAGIPNTYDRTYPTGWRSRVAGGGGTLSGSTSYYWFAAPSAGYTQVDEIEKINALYCKSWPATVTVPAPAPDTQPTPPSSPAISLVSSSSAYLSEVKVNAANVSKVSLDNPTTGLKLDIPFDKVNDSQFYFVLPLGVADAGKSVNITVTTAQGSKTLPLKVDPLPDAPGNLGDASLAWLNVQMAMAKKSWMNFAALNSRYPGQFQSEFDGAAEFQQQIILQMNELIAARALAAAGAPPTIAIGSYNGQPLLMDKEAIAMMDRVSTAFLVNMANIASSTKQSFAAFDLDKILSGTFQQQVADDLVGGTVDDVYSRVKRMQKAINGAGLVATAGAIAAGAFTGMAVGPAIAGIAAVTVAAKVATWAVGTALTTTLEVGSVYASGGTGGKLSDLKTSLTLMKEQAIDTFLYPLQNRANEYLFGATGADYGSGFRYNAVQYGWWESIKRLEKSVVEGLATKVEKVITGVMPTTPPPTPPKPCSTVPPYSCGTP